MASRTFRPKHLVRARWTRLDDCGVPLYDDECTYYVRDCMVSFTWEDQFEDPQEYLLRCDNDRLQFYDRTEPTFKFTQGTLALNDIDPLVIWMMLGVDQEIDAQTQDVVGFRPNALNWGVPKFALELWAALATQAGEAACPGGVQEWAYLLFPFNRNGRWETAPTASNNTDAVEITFDAMLGGSWEDGPYPVVADATGDPSPLVDPMTGDQPYLVRLTTVPPPDVTDGCVPLLGPVSPS